MTKQGIITIALGHTMYGKMATGLAASALSHGYPTTLLTDGKAISTLSAAEKGIFDNIIHLPESVCHTAKGLQYLRAKVFLYDYSPYKETIYFDADSILGYEKPLHELFLRHKDCSINLITEGYYDIGAVEPRKHVNPKYTSWASMEDMVKAFSLDKKTDKLYQLRSEFIYFKKSKKIEKLFSIAKDVYDNPRLVVATLGGSYADEYAFNIAIALSAINLTEMQTPLYWKYIHRRKYIYVSEIFKDFYGISIGGNVISEEQKTLYNSLIRYHYEKNNITGYQIAINKRDYISSRKLL